METVRKILASPLTRTGERNLRVCLIPAADRTNDNPIIDRRHTQHQPRNPSPIRCEWTQFPN